MKEIIVDSIHNETGLDKDQVAKMLTVPKDISHGDLAFPCFILAKQWNSSPQDCAEKLRSLLKFSEKMSKAEGPYLNFFYDRAEQTAKVISRILETGLNYGREKSNTNRTIVVEYSSPNIAKPFHIGHLRTTIIGHALFNTFQHLGYNTVSVNHIGDWGTQFGYVYAGCKFWDTPENASVYDLVKRYIKANTLRKQQESNSVSEEYKDFPNVEETAKQYFLDLEAGDKEATKFWKWYVQVSLDYFKVVYKRLGIKFDHYTGESFYIDKFPAIKKQLEESNILEESNGAFGIDLGKKLGFARLLTEDGRSLYLTRDIVAADYREKEFQPERVLYIVGAPQTLHFQQIVAVMKKMEHPVADKLVHISYGHVPGIGTRNMKSDDLSLEALLDDARARALDAYKTGVSKRPEGVDEEEVAEAVGLGAIYFNYLCRTNIKDFHFTWEEALNFNGDTGPYLQYALARLYSIEARAKEKGLEVTENVNLEQIANDDVYEIITLLDRFPQVLQKVTEDYEPNHIAQFALDLAKAISKNYSSLRVLGEENQDLAVAHLALFKACKNVLEISISLLGIPPLQRM